MTDRKAEAEAFRCALVAGCATVAEVVAWADEVIAADTTPDIAIIELSLAGRAALADVVALLKAVTGYADGIVVRRRLMSRMLRLLDNEPTRGQQVAHSLFRLAINGDLPEEEFGWEPFVLEDAFDLARNQVYGTYETALADLRAYLERNSEARSP